MPTHLNLDGYKLIKELMDKENIQSPALDQLIVELEENRTSKQWHDSYSSMHKKRSGKPEGVSMTAREKLSNFICDLVDMYPHDEMSINELIDEVIQEALQTRIDAFKDNKPTETTLTATSAQINKENEQKDSARHKFIFSMVSYIQQVSMPWLRGELIKALGGIHSVIDEAKQEATDNALKGNWWDKHLRTCGTKYRGCDPECPKEQVEIYAKAMLDEVREEALAEAQATAWISVDERLPDPHQRVLGRKAHTNEDEVVIVSYKRATKGLVWLDDFDWQHSITHWMPLPQPPKEGEAL